MSGDLTCSQHAEQDTTAISVRRAGGHRADDQGDDAELNGPRSRRNGSATGAVRGKCQRGGQ